ncbi:MAG: DegT/DnrJ/EryC1/StrS family aminotransferase [Bacteroidia bacterium]
MSAPRLQMVDLIRQYQRLRPEINQAIQEVLDSGLFIKGPAVKTFEDNLSRYLGGIQVIGCANGTDALQVALMALGIQPGDEVIVPTFTYVATAEVCALLGISIRWIDVDPRTFNIDPSQLEKTLTPRTRAIMVVHLFGQAAPMEEILAFAQAYNVYVIEDAAQALGTEYVFSDGRKQKVGTLGHVGCTSFFPSKNLGCYGDGGAIFTPDPELAQKIRQIANHGQDELYHFAHVGINSRLDSLQAAILNVKLKYLEDFNQRRRHVAHTYDAALGEIEQITVPYRVSHSTHIFHQYTLQVPAHMRNALRTHLQALGIPSMIYYPYPLHLQPAYYSDAYPEGSFPVSERLCKSVLSLPIHTEMDSAQLSYIISGIRSFFT